MADIVAGKLGVPLTQFRAAPITGLTFIRLFYYIFKHAANELGLSEFYDSAIVLSDLEQRMEILACDASCASIRASELALVMLCTQMDAHVSKLDAGSHLIHGLVDYAIQLQKLCRVSFSFSFVILNLPNFKFLYKINRFRTAHSFTRTAPSLKFYQTTMDNRKCRISNDSCGSSRREHFAACDQLTNSKFHHTCQPLKKITITCVSERAASAQKMATAPKKIGPQVQSLLFVSSAKIFIIVKF